MSPYSSSGMCRMVSILDKLRAKISSSVDYIIFLHLFSAVQNRRTVKL